MTYGVRFLVLMCALLPLAQSADLKKSTDVKKSPDIKKSALDKPTLEAYIRHLFGWGPEIRIELGAFKRSPVPEMLEVAMHASQGELVQDEVFYISKDGRKIVRGTVNDVTENPFKANLDKLRTESQPDLGKKGAPVVLVLFSDFQCPFCKEEAKMLRANLTSAYPEQVHLYFKDLPLEQVHPWAKPAAIAGRCVFNQNHDAFWAYHDWVFDHQSEITVDNFRGKVMEFAQGRQMDSIQMARLEQCIATKATEAEVNKSVKEAASLGFMSTPTLFLNGRRLPNPVPWENLKQLIDREIEYQKTAKNAGEDCGCAVPLPGFLPK